MTVEKLRDWLEVIGLFSVVGSLLFVGLQLRLDRQVAMSEGWLQFEETQILLSDLIGRNSELWIKGLDGEKLSPVEQLQFDEVVISLEARFMSRFQRSRMGVRSAEADLEALKFAQELYLHKGLRESVHRRWGQYEEITNHRPPFRVEVERILEKLDSGELRPSNDRNYAH